MSYLFRKIADDTGERRIRDVHWNENRRCFKFRRRFVRRQVFFSLSASGTIPFPQKSCLYPLPIRSTRSKKPVTGIIPVWTYNLQALSEYLYSPSGAELFKRQDGTIRTRWKRRAPPGRDREPPSRERVENPRGFPVESSETRIGQK